MFVRILRVITTAAVVHYQVALELHFLYLLYLEIQSRLWAPGQVGPATTTKVWSSFRHNGRAEKTTTDVIGRDQNIFISSRRTTARGFNSKGAPQKEPLKRRRCLRAVEWCGAPSLAMSVPSSFEYLTEKVASNVHVLPIFDDCGRR